MSTELTKTGAAKFAELMESRRGEFEKALQNNVDVANFTRVAMTTVQRNPKLMECTQASLFTSLINVAQLGLVADSILGQAYLIPFNDKRLGMIAEAVIGYQGYRQLALNSGLYKDIYAHVVYEKDPFEISLGTDEHIKHYPFEGEPGKMRACYAVVVHNDGSRTFEFWWGRKIEKHKEQYSKSWKKYDSLWQTNPEMAWQKTLIKQLCKRLRLSTKAREIINREDRMEAGLDMPPPEIELGEVIDLETGEITEDTGDNLPPKSTLVETLDSKKERNDRPGNLDKEEKKVRVVDKKQQKLDRECMDLQIAIKQKIDEDFPPGNFVDHIQDVCLKVFGGPSDKDNGIYELESLSKEQLKAVWKSF